jgi:hypothetical protein
VKQRNLFAMAIDSDMNEGLKSAAAFVILILSGFSAPRCDATIHDSDGSAASVQALHNAARDGDTITIPAGTFTWLRGITITKGITLKGQTTITGAGTATPTANDQTIILDDTPRGGQILKTTLNPSQNFRITGCTFRPSPTTPTNGTTDGAFILSSIGATGNKTIRVDHCHFANLNQGRIFWLTNWSLPVIDNNFIEVNGSGKGIFFINMPLWGGTNKYNGNGSWEDYPRYGSDNFFFIETNTIIRTTTGMAGAITDSQYGGRFVVRHNYVRNCLVEDHGTEGGTQRGKRVYEVYDNTFDFTVAHSAPGDSRSGTIMVHDNTYTGLDASNGYVSNLSNYREGAERPKSVWGISDGTSPWDANVTDVGPDPLDKTNQIWVDGHAPYLFDSGTATIGGKGTFTDSSKNWAINQWAGYSIRNITCSQCNYKTIPPSATDPVGSAITSNTATTITYNYYGATDTPWHLDFSVGDHYEIHRVLIEMDQNGRGKTDVIIGGLVPVLAATGRPGWAHPTFEPCYQWNNVYRPTGRVYVFNPINHGQPTSKVGIDAFDLGAGFPPDTTPSEVSSTYTAALNGVDYVGPFAYPHPLVSGAPTPTPRATPSSSQHSPQRKENKGKKAKKKNKKRPKKLGE